MNYMKVCTNSEEVNFSVENGKYALKDWDLAPLLRRVFTTMFSEFVFRRRSNKRTVPVQYNQEFQPICENRGEQGKKMWKQSGKEWKKETKTISSTIFNCSKEDRRGLRKECELEHHIVRCCEHTCALLGINFCTSNLSIHATRYHTCKYKEG